MIRYILLFIFSFFLLSSNHLFSQTSFTVETVPNPTKVSRGYIVDTSQKLTANEIQNINEKLLILEKDTSVEFAIVILPSIGEANLKDFAVALFSYWGIGKKEKDNGLLLLLVMGQRRWEFETGYGLESVIPDATLKKIGEDELVPNYVWEKSEMV